MCRFPYLVEVTFATHDDLKLGLVATQRLEVPVLAADDVEAVLVASQVGLGVIVGRQGPRKRDGGLGAYLAYLPTGASLLDFPLDRACCAC